MLPSDAHGSGLRLHTGGRGALAAPHARHGRELRGSLGTEGQRRLHSRGPDACPCRCPEAPAPTSRRPGAGQPHGQQRTQWHSARGPVHGVPLGVWNSPLWGWRVLAGHSLGQTRDRLDRPLPPPGPGFAPGPHPREAQTHRLHRTAGGGGWPRALVPLSWVSWHHCWGVEILFLS